MKNMNTSFGRRLLIVATLALVFMSFRDYVIQFSEGDQPAALYPSFLMASAMVLLYAVPIAFFIQYLAKRLAVSGKVLLLSYILAFTLPLYLGGQGNSLISYALFSLKVPDEILNAWGAALTAPFAEEVAKGAVVLLVYWLCRGISLKEAFIVGMISGFGFQVLEDWAYIFQSTFGETNTGFAIAFERVANALGGHMAFSILFGVGLIALIKKAPALSGLKAVCLLLAPVLIHFIWNSPLEGDWVFPVLGSINLNLAYYAFTSVKNLDEEDRLVVTG